MELDTRAGRWAAVAAVLDHATSPALTLIGAGMVREHLYVALTRAMDATYLYVTTHDLLPLDEDERMDAGRSVGPALPDPARPRGPGAAPVGRGSRASFARNRTKAIVGLNRGLLSFANEGPAHCGSPDGEPRLVTPLR